MSILTLSALLNTLKIPVNGYEIIKLLKEEIAWLKKDSGNSSKPPSSDIVKPKKTVRKVSRKKRKRGGQFGHR